MKALTKEWVRKAEEDYRVARRELAVRRGASLDAVCFRAQQCAEKYLKAVLEEAGTAFPKTHDLEALVHLATSFHATFGSQLSGAKALATTQLKFVIRAVGPRVPMQDC
jgi:HEPN domain-containing protein